MAVLVLENVSVSVESNQLLDSVTAHVTKGHCVGLVGPNGTLLCLLWIHGGKCMGMMGGDRGMGMSWKSGLRGSFRCSFLFLFVFLFFSISDSC